MWHLLKLDCNFGDSLLQPFAGANVERHAGPAPVVKVQLECGKGLSVGVRIYTWLFTIADDCLSQHKAWSVLSSDGNLVHTILGNRSDRLHCFDLLVANAVCV